MNGAARGSTTWRGPPLVLSMLLAALVLAVTVGAWTTQAQAAVSIAVDRNDDPGLTATPEAGACTILDGDCSLRGAIRLANISPGADTINVPANTYTLAVVGTNENEALTGDLDITEGVTIVGEGAKTTIIEAGTPTAANAVDRVFDNLTGPSDISGVTIRNGNPGGNQVSGGIRSLGALTLDGVALTGNTAPFQSGAMDHSGAPLTITNSTIDNNSAQGAGGITADEGSTVLITNTTISNNVGGGGFYRGGGLRLWGNGTTASLNNVTIYKNGNGNSPLSAAGIAVLHGVDEVKLSNTIIAQNDGPNCNSYPRDGSATESALITSQGNNLDTGNTCNLTQASDLVNTNPLLVDALADNGGQTRTHALPSTSPAIDKGNPAAPGSVVNACEATDQRGVTRPQDGNENGTAECDIGAFEKEEPPKLSISDAPAVTEGNSGTTDAAFTVTMDKTSTTNVTVAYATTDGTATAGSDYAATTGTLTFAPGDTSKTVNVPVNGDTADEPDETFTLDLSSPVNATITDGSGTGTITDDDPAPPPDTTAPTGSVSINNGVAKTTSRSVILTLAATDDGSGVSQMCVSSSSTSCTNFEAFAASKPWKLAGKNAGTKTVYVKYKDVAGNVSVAFSDQIKYAPKK